MTTTCPKCGEWIDTSNKKCRCNPEVNMERYYEAMRRELCKEWNLIPEEAIEFGRWLVKEAIKDLSERRDLK